MQPVTFDAPASGASNALSYRDPTGKVLAPVLPPPPIEGPDVSLNDKQKKEFAARQSAAKASSLAQVTDKRGRRWALNNQGRVHMLLAAHSMKKIESMYGSIFEGILGERVSTQPVVVVTPFPWVRNNVPNAQLQGIRR